VAKQIQGPADQTLLPSWVVWGPFGAMLGCIGAMLGPSWAVLRPSWEHLGSIFGSSWAILGSCWPSWGYLGPFWNLSILGCHLGGLEGCLTRFGGSWGSTWPSWGAVLADLKDLPRVLGGPGQFSKVVPHGFGGSLEK
jgi:hypothetical protein